jgi:hypothetical protein
MMNGIQQIDIREFTNALVLVLNCALALIMVAFVISKMATEKDWYTQLAVQGAIALSVLFSGELLIRGWGVVLLYQMSHGGDGWAVEQRVPLSLIGVIVVMVGALCAVRVFTPNWFGRWRNAVWVVTACLALVVGTIVVAL